MAKYTQQQGETHLKHITRAEIIEIAERHHYGWQTLYDCLKGFRDYDGGRPERQAMIKEATELIRERVINDMEAINPQCTCDNPIIRTGYCANCQRDIEII